LATRALAGVDVGTTHCKAGLFTLAGQTLHVASRPMIAASTADGSRYYDPEAVWQAAADAVSEAIGNAAEADIIGIYEGLQTPIREASHLLQGSAEMIERMTKRAGAPANLVTLNEILPPAERKGYAVGSFAPRHTAMIHYVLAAAEKVRSPLIIQISANELRWFSSTAAEFAAEFYRCLAGQRISVPVVLHLDHTKDPAVIEAAMDAGFTSVMIDRSELPLAENIAAARSVVEAAHARRVSVEAELGRIFSADKIETAEDRELLTVPEEAQQFVEQTGVDALAVSVGTAHGVYNVRQPKIDFERLAAIRRLTPVHLVLHGGSGVPPEMVRAAYRLPGGGVSKVNIATDLEQAMLAALGRDKRMSNAELKALPPETLGRAGAAVEATVIDKIENYLGSASAAGAVA
jgi:ketose-bisphosphate aldolase